jgi:hypothetical protein
MGEKEYAKQLIEEAFRARATSGFPFTTVNVSEFGEGKYDFEVMKQCLLEEGFKIIPVEESHLRNTPIKNKYVIIGR